MSLREPDVRDRVAADRIPEFDFLTTSTPQREPRQPRSPRARWVVPVSIVAGIVLMASIVGVAAWVGGAAAARADVQVLWDAHPLSCTSPAETLTNVGDAGDPRYLTLAHINPDLACELHFAIFNNGSSDVRIDSIRMPQLGSDTFLYAAGIDGQRPSYGDDHIDATVRYSAQSNFTLRPGQDSTVTVDLRVRGKACSAIGGYEWWGGPVLGLTANGIPGDVSTPGGPWGVTGTKASTCG